MKPLLLIIFVYCSLGLFAQIEGVFDHNYIDVTGKAEIEVIPDEIFLDITINELDNKGKVSVEELEKQMIKALKNLNVDFEKDFSVNDISSNFKNYWLKKTAIVSSKNYQLIVHSATMAGKVFQELESLGISNISISKVDHSEIEKYRREVKVKAISEAKSKAFSLTAAVGQTIGRALFIRENEPAYYPKNYSNVMMVRGISLMEDDAEVLPEIQFEKIKLEYSVQVYFELK